MIIIVIANLCRVPANKLFTRVILINVQNSLILPPVPKCCLHFIVKESEAQKAVWLARS